MKNILTLLVTAVLLNAAVRGGLAAMQYYQFKEAAQQAVLFGAGTSPSDLRLQILQQGQALEVPITPEKVVVQRLGGRTWADAAYRRDIEFFPNQTYPIDFSFSVEGHSMVLAPPDGK